MDMKKIGKALLFPRYAVMLVLLPVATVLLVFSMTTLGTESVIAILSYVLSFYTLLVWCMRIPQLIELCKTLKDKNAFVQRWSEDAHLRINVSLYGTLLWNVAYAVFQLGLGLYHASFWYYSLAGYYLSLAVMRFFLLRFTRRHKPGEKYREELRRYRTCGVAFLIMNLTLSVMVFFMVYWNRTFHHHEITTIAMAAYTFTAFTLAIRNVIKYRKYNSPVYSAAKYISLAAACVSMLTMEATMLTTFGGSGQENFRRIMLGLSGGAIAAFIIAMAVYMIVRSNRQMAELKKARRKRYER